MLLSPYYALTVSSFLQDEVEEQQTYGSRVVVISAIARGFFIVG
jgi:hypothetical protein